MFGGMTPSLEPSAVVAPAPCPALPDRLEGDARAVALTTPATSWRAYYVGNGLLRRGDRDDDVFAGGWTDAPVLAEVLAIDGTRAWLRASGPDPAHPLTAAVVSVPVGDLTLVPTTDMDLTQGPDGAPTGVRLRAGALLRVRATAPEMGTWAAVTVHTAAFEAEGWLPTGALGPAWCEARSPLPPVNAALATASSALPPVAVLVYDRMPTGASHGRAVATLSPAEGESINAGPATAGWRSILVQTREATIVGVVAASALTGPPKARYVAISSYSDLPGSHSSEKLELPMTTGIVTHAGGPAFARTLAPQSVGRLPGDWLNVEITGVPTAFGLLDGVVICSRLDPTSLTSDASETCQP